MDANFKKGKYYLVEDESFRERTVLGQDLFATDFGARVSFSRGKKNRAPLKQHLRNLLGGKHPSALLLAYGTRKAAESEALRRHGEGKKGITITVIDLKKADFPVQLCRVPMLARRLSWSMSREASDNFCKASVFLRCIPAEIVIDKFDFDVAGASLEGNTKMTARRNASAD